MKVKPTLFYIIKILHCDSRKLSTSSVIHFKNEAFTLTNIICGKAAKGAFNNYVDKMRGGGVKKCLFLSTLKV